MSPNRLPLVLFFASCLPLAAAPEDGASAEKSSKGVWHSIVGGLKAVGDGAGAVAKTASGAVGKVFDFSAPKRTPLRLEVVLGPQPVRLPAGGALNVKLQLFNAGKKTQLLEFASGQRAEIVLREGSGRIVSRAARSVGEGTGMLTVNPGERIEFLLQLPTKEIGAGKIYSLEAAMTGQAGLVTKLPVRIAG